MHCQGHSILTSMAGMRDRSGETATHQGLSFALKHACSDDPMSSGFF